MNPAFPKITRTLSTDPKLFSSPSPTLFQAAKKRKMSRAFTDNINSFNVSNSIILTVADYESKILAWLSPLEPQVRHQDICEERVDTIGGWLLETKEFRDWYNNSEKDGSDYTALFCYGDPGVGKSYLW